MITGQSFEVLRRVYVDFEGISLRRKFLTGVEPESVNIMIGMLHVLLGDANINLYQHKRRHKQFYRFSSS